MGDRQVFQIGAARQVDGQKAAALSLAMATGEDEGWEASERQKSTGQAARVFAEFGYRAKKTKQGGWDRERRVVAKPSRSRARRIRAWW